MDAISVNNLSVELGRNKILTQLSFNIPEKSITAIIGPNGCGKTTLMKAMLGLIPYTGEVMVLNTSVKKALDHISYVPQRFNFDRTFPITVNEFLHLEPNSKYRSTTNIKEKLKEVGMQNSEDNLLGVLSGGQLQRILIAKALLNNPSVLFMDEPAAGIDIKGERNFYELIQHLNKEHNVTIILVSHEIDIVYRYATHVVCLNKKVLCFGKPTDILTSDTIKKLYNEDVEIYQHLSHKHD
jgi:zinc transport system ATP-binding protein